MPSAAVKKLVELIPRKPPAASSFPFTPKDLQSILPGLPQGAATEISGPRSSGRTTLLHACLAEATGAGELCAYVDGSDALDPASAQTAGIQLHRLLWVQCHHELDDALKAADLILHGGGFRLVVLDLCDFQPAELQRVPLSWWHRLRLAVENTPAALVTAAATPVLRQSAAVHIELDERRVHWSTLLDGVDIHVRLRKPVHSANRMATLRAEAK